MSLLQAPTLIRIHALALLPLSYYLLTSPTTITDANLVFMLGEAMSLPQPQLTTTSSPSLSSLSSTTSPFSATTGLSALLLALNSLTDLSTAAALPEDTAHFYWRTAVPVRLLFFFVVTGGSYLGNVREGAMLGGGQRPSSSSVSGHGIGGWREACCNSLVFTWGFLEMVFWFWMFVSLREEGKARAGREAVKRKEKEEAEMR